MPLRRLKLQDFSAFRLSEIDFVDGMNVFVGANGTGKTHLMKVMYALVESARSGSELAAKLAGVFKPEDDQIGRLARRVHGLSTAKVTLHADAQSSIGFELHTKGTLKTSHRAWKAIAPGQPPTRFFAFTRPSVGTPVDIHHGDQLSDLPSNPMEDEFARHYDFEPASMGVNGAGTS